MSRRPLAVLSDGAVGAVAVIAVMLGSGASGSLAAEQAAERREAAEEAARRASAIEQDAEREDAAVSPRGAREHLPASRDVASLPTVASINLCTDQLVLHVADPVQIVTLSWLSADPEESTLAEAAARYPLNYGSAEEILRFDPDVVIGGVYTNAFTRALLRDLGYTVVDIEPATSLDDIEANVRRIAAAMGRVERGEQVVREMQARIARHRRRLDSSPVAAIVVRPGGFTVEAPSLAHELMTLAGLRNLPAELGLDRWGSLSVETLLHHPPELLVFASYRRDDASLANAVLAHPALERIAERTVTADVPASLWSCGLPNSLDAVEMLERAADRARSARASNARRSVLAESTR
ncbi:MAG TPA: ABC transporter substrate-binding protein [Gammaproteobacteria bacterium]